MQVSPNPAGETIQIEVDGFTETCEALITLYNANGVLVQEQTKKIFSGKNNIYFNAENLSNGLYTIRLRTKEGHEMSVKVVVNK
jgi:hypothetical protein